MDQQESSRSIAISSSRVSDKFQPQLIQINKSQFSKFKEDSQEQSPIFQRSNDEFIQETQFRQTRMNYKKTFNNSSQTTTKGNKILKLINQKHLLRKFKESLFKIAHIYPKHPSSQLLHFFEENYIIKNQHHQRNKDVINQFEQEGEQQTETIYQKFRIPIINPTGKFYLFWQFLRLIQIMFLLWWLPFKIAFKPNYDYPISIIEQLLIYLFIVDLIIKLNKGLMNQGSIIYERIKIIKYYMIYELYEDAIYFITLTLVIGEDPIQVSFFPEAIVLTQFTFNFLKFKKTINRYGEMFTVQSTFTELVSLTQLIILIVYLAHFMACIWYYVGNQSQQIYHKTWILQQQIEDQSIFLQYGYSFYWATATMVTVGYGDITPQNIYEVICAIILIFFASVAFAFTLNAIGTIFSNIDIQKQAYKRNLTLINHYMSSNEVSIQLQSRVRNYLKYYYEQQLKGDKQEINQIMEKLSITLKQELLEDVQLRAITQAKFITKHFSSNTVHQIASRIHIQNYTPREIIFQQRSIDESSLYIIQKGEICLVEDRTGKLIKKYLKGDCFGEIEFLTNQKRQFTAISNTFSSIYRLPRETFLDIILENSNDFEKFSEMKDKVMLKLNNSYIKCLACEMDHQLSQCHFLKYQPDVEKVIKKYLFNSDQQREKIVRKNTRFTRVIQHHEEHDIDRGHSKLEVSFQTEADAASCKKSNSIPEQSENYNFNNNPSEEALQKKISLWISNPDAACVDQNWHSNQFEFRTLKHNSDNFTQRQKTYRKGTNNQSPPQETQQKNQPLLQLNEIQPQQTSSNNSNHKKSNQHFNQLDDCKVYYQHTNYDLDKAESFHNYFIHNNLDSILKELQNYQKLLKQFKIQEMISPYRFYCVQRVPNAIIGKKSPMKLDSNC